MLFIERRTVEERAVELAKLIQTHGIDEVRLEVLKKLWSTDPRWAGTVRPYTAEDVLLARGTLKIEYTLASAGADRLWYLLKHEP